MSIEEFILSIIPLLPAFLVKVIAVTLFFLHFIFSIVVTRQTKLMLSVVEAQISPLIYAISLIHFASSLFVLIWAILFL